MGIYDLISDIRELVRNTYVSSSRGFSGVNQLTLTTLSYSSMLLIGIGI